MDKTKDSQQKSQSFMSTVQNNIVDSKKNELEIEKNMKALNLAEKLKKRGRPKKSESDSDIEKEFKSNIIKPERRKINKPKKFDDFENFHSFSSKKRKIKSSDEDTESDTSLSKKNKSKTEIIKSIETEKNEIKLEKDCNFHCTEKQNDKSNESNQSRKRNPPKHFFDYEVKINDSSKKYVLNKILEQDTSISKSNEDPIILDINSKMLSKDSDDAFVNDKSNFNLEISLSNKNDKIEENKNNLENKIDLDIIKKKRGRPKKADTSQNSDTNFNLSPEKNTSLNPSLNSNNLIESSSSNNQFSNENLGKKSISKNVNCDKKKLKTTSPNKTFNFEKNNLNNDIQKLNLDETKKKIGRPKKTDIVQNINFNLLNKEKNDTSKQNLDLKTENTINLEKDLFSNNLKSSHENSNLLSKKLEFTDQHRTGELSESSNIILNDSVDFSKKKSVDRSLKINDISKTNNCDLNLKNTSIDSDGKATTIKDESKTHQKKKIQNFEKSQKLDLSNSDLIKRKPGRPKKSSLNQNSMINSFENSKIFNSLDSSITDLPDKSGNLSKLISESIKNCDSNLENNSLEPGKNIESNMKNDSARKNEIDSVQSSVQKTQKLDSQNLELLKKKPERPKKTRMHQNLNIDSPEKSDTTLNDSLESSKINLTDEPVNFNQENVQSESNLKINLLDTDEQISSKQDLEPFQNIDKNIQLLDQKFQNLDSLNSELLQKNPDLLKTNEMDLIDSSKKINTLNNTVGISEVSSEKIIDTSTSLDQKLPKKRGRKPKIKLSENNEINDKALNLETKNEHSIDKNSGDKNLEKLPKKRERKPKVRLYESGNDSEISSYSEISSDSKIDDSSFSKSKSNNIEKTLKKRGRPPKKKLNENIEIDRNNLNLDTNNDNLNEKSSICGENLEKLPKKRGRKPKIRLNESGNDSEISSDSKIDDDSFSKPKSNNLEKTHKKRGRPPKIKLNENTEIDRNNLNLDTNNDNSNEKSSSCGENLENLPKKRGRKPKVRLYESDSEISSDKVDDFFGKSKSNNLEKQPKKRGRPPKVTLNETQTFEKSIDENLEKLAKKMIQKLNDANENDGLEELSKRQRRKPNKFFYDSDEIDSDKESNKQGKLKRNKINWSSEDDDDDKINMPNEISLENCIKLLRENNLNSLADFLKSEENLVDEMAENDKSNIRTKGRPKKYSVKTEESKKYDIKIYDLFSKKYYRCMRCQKMVATNLWYSHNLNKHNNIGWRQGEPKINDKNLDKLMGIFNNLYARQKHQFRCEQCNMIKVSPLGFYAHLSTCGKTIDEQELLKVECKYCQKPYFPWSLPMHLKAHEKPDTEEPPSGGNIKSGEISDKRKSFKKANSVIELTKKYEKEKLSEYFEYGAPEFVIENYNLLPKRWSAIKESNSNAVIKCPHFKCDFESTDLNEITQHYQFNCIKLNIPVYSCKLCRMKTSRFFKIANHLKSKHNFRNGQLLDDKDKPDDGGEEEEEDPYATDNDEEYKAEYDENETDESDSSFDNEDENIMDELNEKSSSESDNEQSSRCSSSPKFAQARDRKKERFTNNNFAYLYKSNWMVKRRRGFRPKINYDLAKEFRGKNYSKKLFEEFMPREFYFLDKDEGNKYLPEVNRSLKYVLFNRYNMNVQKELKTFQLFDSDFNKGNSTFFCGGPIWSLAWCPNDLNLFDDQYLAVSTHRNMTVEYSESKSYNDYGLIQIWNCGKLKNSDHFAAAPYLYLSIAHDYGPIWHMEWCPSGCFEIDSKVQMKRLGLLALTCGDNCLRILSVPLIQNLDQEKIVCLKPSVKLIYYLSGSENLGGKEAHATKLCWSKLKDHNKIAAGFSNGFVAIWDLNTKSSFLRDVDKDGTVILSPYISFQTHLSSISVLSFATFDDCRWLLTGSLCNGLKIWDLEHREMPIFADSKRFPLNGIWVSFWNNYVVANDPSNNLTQLYFANSRNIDPCKPIPVVSTESVSYALSCNDWTGTLVFGTEMGQLFMLTLGLFNDLNDTKKVSAKRIIFGYANSYQSDNKQNSIIKYSEKSDLTKLPISYDEFVEKDFIVVIQDFNPKVKSDIPLHIREKCRTTITTLASAFPNMFPILGINVLTWNPNPESYKYLAIGYQSGFVRVIKFQAENI